MAAATMLGVGGAGMLQPGADPASKTKDSVIAPPSPRDARDLGIGRYVPDVKGLDLNGKAASWRTGRGEKLTVIALTSITCPLCKKFAPSLARIEASYASKGVKFVYVNVSGEDSADAMRGQVRDQGFKGLYLNDKDQSIVAALHAKTTTEVFVIDAGNTLVYRGAVSDQYGVGFGHDAPRQRFLENALDAALAGQRPAISATSSPGCAIEFAADAAKQTTPAEPAPITYTKDIARIVQNDCIECHRSGGVAPFSLETFEAVSKRASMIRTVTQEGIMPPWFAVEPKADGDDKANDKAAHFDSPWANDRSLSDAEKETIVAWIKAGKPRGNDADLPLPSTFATGEWRIGKPSAVYQLPEPIAIKADGVMPYQIVMVPTDLAEDTWVRGTQIIPTDKAVVHHVLVFVLPEAALRDPNIRRRAAIDESGGFFAAYVPGNDSVIYPDGLAKRLPRKSVLLFQIHYTPNGKATRDQMKIGFLFDEQAPKHIVRTAGIAARGLSIPPNAANHEERASVRMPADAKVLAFMPHMHVRGKAFRYELDRPGDAGAGEEDGGMGGRELLLDIPRYDFNWQLRYLRREPLDVPKGSTIYATAWYDNSAGNSANPDPSKTVRWGPQTYDEMMLGYVEYYLVQEDPSHPEELPAGSTPGRRGGGGGAWGAGGRGLSFESLLTQFDANKDGKIEKKEVPENLHRQFDRLDRNKDGVLTKDDFAR
ncbi:MAG: redoxin family protein [Phycisphaerales bacterium]|nr:redoxin family protein [Phycisphaerales bacterium]